MAKVTIKGVLMECQKDEKDKENISFFAVLYQAGEKTLQTIKNIPFEVAKELVANQVVEFFVQANPWATKQGQANISYKFIGVAD